MYENVVNPYLKTAQNHLRSLSAFVEQAKKEAVQPPSDSVYINPAVDQARGILLGHAQLLDLLQNTNALHRGLRAREVSDLQAKAYIFSTGVDLAVRGMAPFLCAAAVLIKKLMESGRLNVLAQRVQEIFDHFSGDDVNRLVDYLQKTSLAKGISEKKLRQKINEMVKEKTSFIGVEVDAHEDALKEAGFAESDIPGYLLILGYMAGRAAAKVLPKSLSEP